MKTMLALATPLILLVGCTSLQNAGTSSYSIKPFEKADGSLVCCDATFINGKEYASFKVKIELKDGFYTLDLDAKGVEAFEGQRIASVVAHDAAKVATSAAMVAGGVLIAPVAAPAIGAIIGSGSAGAVAAGAVGATIINNSAP